MNEKFKEILNSVKPEILEESDCDLVEDGIIDSLCIMALIARCEEVFEIDFDPDDIIPENFASAEAIWAVVQKHLEENSNG